MNPLPLDHDVDSDDGAGHEITQITPSHYVVADDVKRLNQLLCRLQDAWAATEDVRDICALANTTAKIIELRRKALLLPFGVQGESRDNPGRGRQVSPFDD